MTSSDASDKMLKGAHKTRWERRKEPAFDDWVIEEANWLTMEESIVAPPGGFDAGVLLGNSFAHLPDFHGDMRDHKKCMANFVKLIKPGGIFIIDHRSVVTVLCQSLKLMIDILSETMITFWPMEKLLPRTSTTTAITSMTSRPVSSTSTTSPTSSHWTTSWMWIRRTQTATSSGSLTDDIK